MQQLVAPARAERRRRAGSRRRIESRRAERECRAQRSAISSDGPDDLDAAGLHIGSERIHFQDSRNASRGKRKAASAESLQAEVGKIGAGISDQVQRARSRTAVFQEGSWAWYDTRLSRQADAERTETGSR